MVSIGRQRMGKKGLHPTMGRRGQWVRRTQRMKEREDEQNFFSPSTTDPGAFPPSNSASVMHFPLPDPHTCTHTRTPHIRIRPNPTISLCSHFILFFL